MSTSAWTQHIDIPAVVLERAMSHYEVDDNGCWISTYSRGSHGYAQIGWHENGRTRMILHHRATWTASNGDVPEGMTLDHLCCVRPCVNPAHLQVLSMEANGRRQNGRVENLLKDHTSRLQTIKNLIGMTYDGGGLQ